METTRIEDRVVVWGVVCWRYHFVYTLNHLHSLYSPAGWACSGAWGQGCGKWASSDQGSRAPAPRWAAGSCPTSSCQACTSSGPCWRAGQRTRASHTWVLVWGASVAARGAGWGRRLPASARPHHSHPQPCPAPLPSAQPPWKFNWTFDLPIIWTIVAGGLIVIYLV